MPPTEQQAQAQLKAAEMLEEMIKCTHQLDEILQRLCAADTSAVEAHERADVPEPPSEERAGGNAFQDCIDSVAGDDGQLAAEVYVQTIRRAFRASRTGKIEISAAPVDTDRLRRSLDGGGDLVLRFASCTRDTAFAFPSLACSDAVGGVGEDGGSTERPLAAAPPPEFNVSYSGFLSRLRQQIVACDHIVPVGRADAAAQLAFLLLEEQQRWLLGAISNHFPYRREAVYWTQGNRVCEVLVQETQQESQWGLLVQLNVTSQLRARMNKHTASPAPEDPGDPANNRDPGLSSCTHCMVFLPKTHYLQSTGAEFQASIAVELVLHDPEEQHRGVSEFANHDTANSNRQGEVGTENIPMAAQLSELLTVSQWGTHDDDPTSDDKTSARIGRKHKGENWFKKVEIETPFPRNRIVQAACGRFHTLFLNDMGLVFAYGHALDGALGLGYEVSGYVAQPTLVDFFFDNLIVVQDIACGGDQLVGAHSAAVSQDGGLFSWGVGIALGKGTLRSQRVLVHKLLLAQRSPVLRELILDEEQQQQNRLDGADGDVSSRTVSQVSKTSIYLVNDVLRAAKLYKLPGLARLCHERLRSASPSSLFGASTPHVLDEIDEGHDELSDTDREGDMDGEDIDSSNAASRTLNDDMRFALSDVIWADTVLVAEGRPIPVHRCMLVARSEYFRAVLTFQHSTTYVKDGMDADKAVVNVEDTYAGIVRVLRFIYYDQVALPAYKGEIATRPTTNNTSSSENKVASNAEEEASDQLLEDLVAADKYGLERMKRLCEHAINVTLENSLEVLAVAELVHAAHLKQVAMRFVQTHLAAVTARQEEFQRFQEDFPQLLEQLYASLRDASRDEFLLREWHKDVGSSLAAQREEEELEWGKKSAVSFPWIPLSLAVAFGTMFLSLMHSEEHEYSAVPATNLVAIVAIGGAITMGYL
ncbi:putative transmembrane protein [Phytophthora cinnamomi]|uniref:putative transmembrane protein n=1 Tax=Phytophthora cinnamomi TaxID=4785 RepID=UPI00355965A8|nr:putative transmembrane protein [Phytophthora cinnamomi]